ncbi:MAG: hypothetical protein IMF09_01250, partial [Proteobacteria bacterium]|nr:hypothetical protein [Pseudomonadota bacterium]
MRYLLINVFALMLLLMNFSVQAQHLLIKNARIHTMGVDGILEDSDILIRDGKLRELGKNLQAGNE